MSISTAQTVDSLLHVEEYKSMMNNIRKPSNLGVLWKIPYKNAKIGYIINRCKVVGVFTLTVWVEKF